MITNFSSVPAKIWAAIVAFAMFLTGVLDAGTAKTSTDAVKLVNENKIVLEKAMFAGQGITTDGTYYYTSGAMTAANMNGLGKWNMSDFSLTKYRLQAIPKDLNENHHSDHIGGISYYNGYIYAAVENKEDDYPLIITYEKNSLCSEKVYELPKDILPDGVPWCAVDAENGYLYCSPFRNVSAIAAFNLSDMTFSHFINLSEPITRIQGGEVYKGVLYLSIDNADSNEDAIYGVDVQNGSVSLICTRTVPSKAGNETEDLTVYPTADGAFFHVIDYDKSVGIYIRNYSYSALK